VDDELAFADTLSDILNSRGYRTVTANDGAEGKRLVRQQPVDLALIDLKLPDVPGIDVLAHIREASPTTEVIILTGHASLDTALRALNLGAFGYVEKPYDIDRLFVLIERALARRRRPDVAPRASELARLLESAGVPAFVSEPEHGVVTAYNAAFAGIFPAPEHATKPPSLADVLAGAGPDAARDHLARLSRSGRAATDVPLRRDSGPAAWFELTSSAPAGRPGPVFNIMSDVTVRRAAEAESRRARGYFEAVLDSLATGVAVIDSHYAFQRVNAAFARFYGASAESLVGRKCHEVMHGHRTPCQSHGEVCPVTNCLATGTTTRIQHRHVDADGTPHFQETTMTPLRDENGTVVSFVAVYADFTEMKQAQQESEAKSIKLGELNRELAVQGERLIAQTVELEKANTELVRLAAARDDLVSMVSHELRTPLTAISEGVNLIADTSLGPVNEQQRRFLSLVVHNCGRLTEMVNDLLDLSKIEAGRMDVYPARLDLAQAVAEIEQVFSASARERNLALTAAGIDQPCFVYADERMVRRALNNLVSNAIKFTERGGITVRLDARTDHVLVSVADSGIGIPASAHARIFEKFHEVRHADRGRPAGTGLGLALTREIVAMNGGRIWFESQENVGTTFHFSLPLDSDVTRVSAMLSRRGVIPPPRARAALLVSLLNPGDLRRLLGDEGVIQAGAVIDHLVAACPLGVITRQQLPESRDTLLLLEGTEAELAAQQQALFEQLRSAVVGSGSTTAPVRTGVGCRRLNGQSDPREFLRSLRQEVRNVV
jgi:PAS domain S-box-containing protein